MKKILAILFSLLTALTVQAQFKTISLSVTADTPTNALTGGNYIVTGIQFVNANTTNTGNLWFYDATGVTTNRVRAAHTLWSSYATNITSTFTNSSGLIITNTFAGTYRYSTSVSAATNEAPKILGPYYIPSSTSVEIDGIAYSPAKGLTAWSTVAGALTVTYRVEPQ